MQTGHLGQKTLAAGLIKIDHQNGVTGNRIRGDHAPFAKARMLNLITRGIADSRPGN